MRIDLHAHTAVSDGTDTPTGLVHCAARAGLAVVAITDHDTVGGWDEAGRAIPGSGVALVRGAEISCSAEGISVHMLSYLHDPADAPLSTLLERTRTSRERRAHAMVAALAEDFPITWADVVAQAADAAAIGRPHMADALVAAGVFPDRSAAFQQVLHNRGPYHIPLEVPHPAVVVELIRGAGGVPVMAHPLAAARGRVVSDAVLGDLVDAGLAAFETDHRDHDPAARAHLRGLAARLGVLTTGSSDYHGKGKPNRIGENLTAPAVYETLMSQGRGEVLQ